jgi:hypothetical protein
VTYTYTLVNGGIDTLFHVAVTDDSCSPVAYQSGDVNNDQLLQPGETWMFTCTHTFTTPGSYTNHATAAGTDTGTGLAVSSSTASATVTVTSGGGVAGGHITLAKSADPTVGVAPLAVTYTYTLANDGSDTLFHPAVTDDDCGPVGYSAATPTTTNCCNPVRPGSSDARRP